jgi:tetratricopeptide (TPR) repeat protein
MAVGICSCEDFLDAKPEKSLVVPTTLNDLQALLDNGNRMNMYSGISDIGTDDVLLEEGAIEGFSNPIVEGNSYLWKEDILEGFNFGDWQNNYSNILYSNIVLDQLELIEVTNANRFEWESIKGSALFFRAYSYFDLLRLFAPTYQESSASTNPGVPLRLSPEPIFEVPRSSLAESYGQVIKDLEEAKVNLTERYREYPTRPSKQAAAALLARVYLVMGDYSNAAKYAEESIGYGGNLMDYGSLNPNSPFPIPQFNSEVVFHTLMTSYSYLRLPSTFISPELYESYDNGDFRKSLYFRNSGIPDRKNFRGNYTSGSSGFSGIALDEVYLILSESLIRIGQIKDGISVLNELLKTRWDESEFVPYDLMNSDDALNLVLLERRKSLVFRGRRWEDLKRLNMEDQFKKTLSREYGGIVYTLPPNSPRYIYPIPESEIQLNPIAQNIRKE